MEFSAALEQVLDEFMGIAAIPRPSHHEEKIAAYLCRWAERHHLNCSMDALGNVMIDKPATPGREAAPRVILQAHMDMVCVAEEGVAYNPLEDAVKVVREGTDIRAEGTSLGADDGIGIAIALYVLSDPGLSHGPLRALFTVNEEDGMSSGAIDPECLNAAYLINLDWEWLGSLCNSSAGGDFMTFTRSYAPVPAAEGTVALRVELSGLLGGHSGVDIHKGRANALSCLGELLLRLTAEPFACQLCDFYGGQARNAIPSSACAVLLCSPAVLPEAEKEIDAYAAVLKAHFGDLEPGLQLRREAAGECAAERIPEEAAAELLRLLRTLPNGVHTMSPYAAGLVESSQNLGLLESSDGELRLSAMARSCAVYRTQELLLMDRLLADAFGFAFDLGEHSPAWAVNPKSRLTPLVCEVYRDLTGDEMVVEPVHGALECGAFFEKNPALDMIAIGPSLFDVHTPKERCDLHSVQVTIDLIVEVLRHLCE